MYGEKIKHLANHHITCTRRQKRVKEHKGRGHRTSLSNKVSEVLLIPFNEECILNALNDLSQTMSHLKENIKEGIKWYIIMHATFPKAIQDETGLLIENEQNI